MGAVYVAKHRVIDRRVAVKVLKRELTDDKALVVRFMNEARAAAAIHHPNIIDVMDVGTLDGGVPYIMTELLPGECLAARLAHQKKLTVAEALEVTRQAESAWAAAHDKGIVHRDLKRDNRFISPDPSNPAHERVKVPDFGIAKVWSDLARSANTWVSGGFYRENQHRLSNRFARQGRRNRRGRHCRCGDRLRR
jgi:serine/threonine-protein kinase